MKSHVIPRLPKKRFDDTQDVHSHFQKLKNALTYQTRETGPETRRQIGEKFRERKLHQKYVASNDTLGPLATTSIAPKQKLRYNYIVDQSILKVVDFHHYHKSLKFAKRSDRLDLPFSFIMIQIDIQTVD